MTPQEQFITYLKSLTEKQERGALAALRRGLGQPPGTTAEMYRYVVPRLPANVYKQQEAAYYIVASLFALHPKPRDDGNVGSHMAETLRGNPNGKEALERRFTALLSANSEDLPNYLRQAVSFLKSKEVAINWLQLLKDLQGWNSDSRYVQQNWANDFWRRTSAESPSPAPSAEAEEI
jgi:CRISPR system Cascade subunit CasB